MPTMKCDLCEVTVKAETFEEWMNTLKPHYGEVHADFMKAKGALPPEEQQAEMGKWMTENQARFEAL